MSSKPKAERITSTVVCFEYGTYWLVRWTAAGSLALRYRTSTSAERGVAALRLRFVEQQRGKLRAPAGRIGF
eukprot:scaffold30919_cov38-Prasinocladus_malaysianus.AAC.1